MEMGVRALARLLITYQTKYGLKTLAQLINRWAPPSENNTSAYISAVAQYFAPAIEKTMQGQRNIYLDDFTDLLSIVEGIISHENGLTMGQVTSLPLSAQIQRGVDLAMKTEKAT